MRFKDPAVSAANVIHTSEVRAPEIFLLPNKEKERLRGRCVLQVISKVRFFFLFFKLFNKYTVRIGQIVFRLLQHDCHIYAML